MASRGQPITLSYYAFDTANSAPKTGDVAQHTIRLVKDGGTPAAPTNAAAEVDGTNLPGWYQVLLTAGECTANAVVLGGKSSTSGIVITGTQVTFEQLPTAAAGANGGLPTGDASGRVLLQPTQTGVTIPTVTAVGTLTTYTGNTPQTGDAFARIGANGAGLTAIPSGDLTAAAVGATSLTLSQSPLDPASATIQTGNQILITGGTLGVGQTGTVTASNTSTGVQTIAGGWSKGVTPTGTVTYAILTPAASSLTAAQVATAVWQDTTSGDFTVTGSPGKFLINQLAGVFTGTTSVLTTAALVNAPTGGSAPTAAAIATAVWQDTTSGDFTVTGSPGKFLISQLAGAMVGTTSVFSTGALANGPSGGGGGGSGVLASNGLDAVILESGITAKQGLSIILAACAGQISGAGTGVVTLKAGGNPSTTRCVAVCDNQGNRSSVTLTLP